MVPAKALGSTCSRTLIIRAVYIVETRSIATNLSADECDDQVEQGTGAKADVHV